MDFAYDSDADYAFLDDLPCPMNTPEELAAWCENRNNVGITDVEVILVERSTIIPTPAALCAELLQDRLAKELWKPKPMTPIPAATSVELLKYKVAQELWQPDAQEHRQMFQGMVDDDGSLSATPTKKMTVDDDYGRIATPAKKMRKMTDRQMFILNGAKAGKAM